MKNIIIILAVIVILALAVTYIIKAKKSGKKCIGCPNGSNCSKNCCQYRCDDKK